MKTYKIILKAQAVKFIEKQSREQRLRLYKTIYALHSGDVKKLVAEKDYYRLRVGTYRIIFQLQQGEYIINIIKANNRGQIYK